MSELTLNIVSPKGVFGPVYCDSVQLTVCDDLKGKGGGSYGIRSGHIESLLTLDKGIIKAFLEGKNILTAKCDCGFATVKNNTVTAVVEDFTEA